MKILVIENLTSKYGQEQFHRFDMDISDKVSKLLDDFSMKTKIPSINLNLYKDDSILDIEQRAEFYNFLENEALTIGLREVNDLDDNFIKINIEYYLTGKKCQKLFVKSNDTVASLKETLINELNIIGGSKSIFFGNIVMQDNKTLDQYGVRDYSRITLKQNVLLKNISRSDCDCNFDGAVRISFESNESTENFKQLAKAINIDRSFINVIGKKEIVNELAAGEYLCFICDENYSEDSIIVFVKESFTESGEFKTHSLVLRGSYRVDETTTKIKDTLDITNEFKLKCGDVMLNKELDLAANKVSDFSELILCFRICIKNMINSTNFMFWISLDYSVLQLKEIIAHRLETSDKSISLTFQGSQLEDNDLLLSNYEIDEGSIILMICTVIGGEGLAKWVLSLLLHCLNRLTLTK